MYEYGMFGRYYDMNNFFDEVYNVNSADFACDDRASTMRSSGSSNCFIYTVSIRTLYPKSIDNYCTLTKEHDIDHTLSTGDLVIGRPAMLKTDSQHTVVRVYVTIKKMFTERNL